MAPSPKKFKPTAQDLAEGKARISVTSWMAGMDPVVPATPKKKKSPKKSPGKSPMRGWFSWNAKAKNNDSAYDADESAGDDVPLLEKNGGQKSILKNGDEPGPSQPKKAVAKKPATPRGKKTGALEVIAEDTKDITSYPESEASSALVIIKKLKCKKLATPVTDAETSEATSEAATTSVEESTEAEMTSAGEEVLAAQLATQTAPETTDDETQTAPETTDDEATQTAPETTDDEATQTAPVTRDDEAQPVPVAEAAPVEAAPVEAAPVEAAPVEAAPAVQSVAAPADPDWSPSQDAMLIAMKDGGEPWKAIATALGKPKKACSARFKILQKNKEADNTAAGASAPPTAAPVSATGVNTLTIMPSPSASKKSPVKASPVKASPVKGSPVKASPAKPATAKQSKKSKAKGKGKAKANTPVDSSSDGGYSVDEHMEYSAILEEETEQMLSRLYSAYSGRYSPEIKSDPNFSALDCRVLGVLEAKKKAEHWMELQAAFFNVTGRMVPIELIKEKMGASQ